MTIDLTRFCNQRDGRELMQSPFNLDGRTVATNGHILISVPRQTCDAAIDTQALGVNSIRRILSKLDAQTYIPCPPLDIPPPAGDCTACAGTGKSTATDCDECGGKGEIDIDYRRHTYTVICLECRGDGCTSTPGGTATCADCCGTGKCWCSSASASAPVPGTPLKADPKYLTLIEQLPGPLFVASDSATGMLFFRAYGADVVLMAARQM